MDEDLNERLSGRARRAIPLIAVAIAVIVTASLVYLHPSFGAARRTLTFPSPTPSPSLIPFEFSVTYDFATPTAGWSLVADTTSTPSRFWIYATTDGARHWSAQLSGQCPVDVLPIGIQFFDGNRGFASLACGLYRTSDGGNSWERVPLPPYQESWITFADPLDGWYLSQITDQQPVPHFLVTHDGGRTWSELPTPPVLVFGAKGGLTPLVQFRDARHGWMGADTGNLPTVYSTSDGGASWQAHVLPSITIQPGQGGKPFPTGTSIELVPGGGVMAMTSDPPGNPVAFTSSDGGASWRRIAAAPGNTAYADFVFVDSRNWWAMRFGTLFKTSDSGQTWKQVALMMDDWDYTLGIIDSRHAWARLRADQGPGRGPPQGTGLATTADGGLHWTDVNPPRPS